MSVDANFNVEVVGSMRDCYDAAKRWELELFRHNTDFADYLAREKAEKQSEWRELPVIAWGEGGEAAWLERLSGRYKDPETGRVKYYGPGQGVGSAAISFGVFDKVAANANCWAPTRIIIAAFPNTIITVTISWGFDGPVAVYVFFNGNQVALWKTAEYVPDEDYYQPEHTATDP